MRKERKVSLVFWLGVAILTLGLVSCGGSCYAIGGSGAAADELSRTALTLTVIAFLLVFGGVLCIIASGFLNRSTDKYPYKD